MDERIANMGFAPEALISTPNGLKAISNLQIGDEVYTYDFTMCEKGIDTIEDINVYDRADGFYTINNNLRTASEVIFYQDVTSMCPAECLSAGMVLINDKVINTISYENEYAPCYNLKLKSGTNYYVGQDEMLIQAELEISC